MWEITFYRRAFERDNDLNRLKINGSAKISHSYLQTRPPVNNLVIQEIKILWLFEINFPLFFVLRL